MKKAIGIGLVVAVVTTLCFGSVALAAPGDLNIDVDGGDLEGVTVTGGSDEGHLYVHVYQHTSPDVGSHHWFMANGGFDATVSASPGPSGSGLLATSMHGTSRSSADFTGGGAQNFDVTGAWPDDNWGMIEYYVSGSDSAELDTVIGGAKFHRSIGGDYYTLLTATGDYNAMVSSWLIDSTAVSFDTSFGEDDVIAGGYVNFYNDSPGSVIWDNYVHPTKTGISADYGPSISIPDDRAWHTVGNGWLEQEAWGAGGISNWNGQSITGPDAYAYQEIYHGGGTWDYFAGISAY